MSSVTTMPQEQVLQWAIQDVSVEVVLKSIKNIHFGVYPPEGKVRVAAPASMDHDMLKLAIVQKLGWIRTQRSKFLAVERHPPREFVEGESHYIFGQRYRLKIALGSKNEAKLEKNYISLTLLPSTYKSFEARKRFIESWFKILLAQNVRDLCIETGLNVDLSAISIRKMRTKWFGANPDPKKAWINIELIKEPPEKLILILKAL